MEVHYRATWLNSPVNNRRLHNLLSTLLSHEDGTKRVALPEEAGEITVPGFSFNVVFQLSHILNHLLHEGVGLRQLVDYYYLLRSHACSTENQAWLDTRLKSCGLHQISSAVSWMLMNVLGLPEKYLITSPNERYGQQLMREMMAGGNFGKYDERLLSGTSRSKLVATSNGWCVMPAWWSITQVNVCGNHGSECGTGCGGRSITGKFSRRFR